MKIEQIPVKEFYKMAEFTPHGYVSTNDIDRWLKLKTNDEFRAVEKALIQDATNNLQNYSSVIQKINDDFEKKWSLNISILKDFENE